MRMNNDQDNAVCGGDVLVHYVLVCYTVAAQKGDKGP